MVLMLSILSTAHPNQLLAPVFSKPAFPIRWEGIIRDFPSSAQKQTVDTTAKIAINYDLTSRDRQQVIDYFYGRGTFSNTNVTLLKCLQQTAIKSKELRDIENRSK
jgi:hypothetical protein